MAEKSVYQAHGIINLIVRYGWIKPIVQTECGSGFLKEKVNSIEQKTLEALQYEGSYL